MVTYVALGVSLAANIALAIAIFFLFRKTKSPPPIIQKTYDAVQLMNDLTMHGASLVKIERIDPTDLFFRGSK